MGVRREANGGPDLLEAGMPPRCPLADTAVLGQLTAWIVVKPTQKPPLPGVVFVWASLKLTFLLCLAKPGAWCSNAERYLGIRYCMCLRAHKLS